MQMLVPEFWEELFPDRIQFGSLTEDVLLI